MNLQQYLTPENVTLAAGIAGGVVALALVGLAIWNRRSISKSITSLWQNTFSQGGLFYFGMALFMLASVVEAGPVLNKIAMHGALWGYGGHMLVFAFDMIASVSLRARLNARRVFDTRGMKLQMWGIWLPALVSISANLAGAIQSFNANDFNHLFIFAWLLPLIGAVFPSMIVVLSLAADHLIDTTAINDKIDPEEFKKQEKKRIDILKVRLQTETELLEEEQKIATLRQNQVEASTSREWFWMKWIRPHIAPPMTAIKNEIEKAVNEVQLQLQQQMNAQNEVQLQLQQQVSTQSAITQTSLSSVEQALAAITEQLRQISTTQQHLAQQVSGQSDQLHRFNLNAHDQQQQFTTLKAKLEGVASTVENLKLNQKTASEASKRETSKKGKVVNLHPYTGEASNEGATTLQNTGEMNLSKKEQAFIS